MNQTQPMPRRSWEGGTVQPGGTVPINISGQSGQWRIPVPAGAVRAELLCQGLWGWLQGDGDPALALRGLSGMLAESNGGRLEGIEARMWGAPGDWCKWHAGDQWGRVRLQTGAAHLQALNSSVLAFSGQSSVCGKKAELQVRQIWV